MYLLFNRIFKKIFNKIICLKDKFWKFNFLKKNKIYPPALKKQNAFNFIK